VDDFAALTGASRIREGPITVGAETVQFGLRIDNSFCGRTRRSIANANDPLALDCRVNAKEDVIV